MANIELDGSSKTIKVDTGDLTLDVPGEIHFDADGAIIRFKDNGTAIGTFENVSSDFIIKSSVSDKDLIFKGNDGGSAVTALTLDMSDAGAATFNSSITAGGLTINGGTNRQYINNGHLRLSDDYNLEWGGGTNFIRGSNANNRLIFQTNGSERMRIISDGNVGIGDTAPDTLLHITQGGEPPAEGMLILEANSASRQLRIQPPTDADNGFIDYKGGNLVFMDDGTEVARFQGSTAFGIGTSNPAGKLHVESDAGGVKLLTRGASSSTTTSNDADELFVDNTGNSGITIGSGTSSLGSIHFGDSGDNDIGRIVYDHSDNSLAFRTNGGERMTIASTGATTITTGDNSDTLKLVSTDDDASVGPVLHMVRDSASPADGDSIGRIHFSADNDAGEEEIFARIKVSIVDASNGSEDAKMRFSRMVGGGDQNMLSFESTETVFNDDSKDIDFRVESDGNTHMLFVDAGNDHVNIGTATDLGATLNVSGTGHFETTGNETTLTLKSTDADASAGPRLMLRRDSGSPADDDDLGKIFFFGKNDNAEDQGYAEILAEISDASDGTEDGRLVFNMRQAGATTEAIRCEGSNGVVVNEGSADVDFRVESNSNTNMLFVDGGNDSVHIGSATVESSDVLAVYSSGANTPVRICNTNANATAPSLIFQKNSSSPSDSDEMGVINFIGQDDNGGAEVYAQIVGIATDVSNGSEDGQIALGTKAAGTFAYNMRIGSNILIGTTDNSPAESSSSTGMRLGTNGGTQISTNGVEVARFNRIASDSGSHTLITLARSGTSAGTIAVSGTTVSYNAFTGSHWSRLADNSKPTILRGTIMESIDEMCDWYQAVVDVPEVLWTADDNLLEGVNVGDVKEEAYQFKESISLGDKSVGDSITFTKDETEYTGTIVKEEDEKHVKSKVSDTVDSKKIYGVFSGWCANDDGAFDDDVNDMEIAQVGTFIIRVNKDVTVEAGDLLVSNGDGTAKLQEDDIIRSKTVAKVNSNIKVETYSDGSYTVPCTLHC